jgi:hypothetical protein
MTELWIGLGILIGMAVSALVFHIIYWWGPVPLLEDDPMTKPTRESKMPWQQRRTK